MKIFFHNNMNYGLVRKAEGVDDIPAEMIKEIN